MVYSVVYWIQDLPVNIKFVIEGMEEAGSVGLEELVRKEKDQFFSSVDYIVISDNLWLSQRKPALTYGTRGNSYFRVEVFAVVWREESVLGSWGEERKLLGEQSSELEAWPGGPGSLGTGGFRKPPNRSGHAVCIFLEGEDTGVCDSDCLIMVCREQVHAGPPCACVVRGEGGGTGMAGLHGAQPHADTLTSPPQFLYL